jgi:leucyl aminopeptidase
VSQEVDVIRGLKVGQTLGKATNVARDLVNEPANYMTPEQLAKDAVEAGEKFGFAVEVLEKDAIEELGMRAFLEVGKASVNLPRLIVMRHLGNPEQPEQILGLVGKGITFDSGGLSIKPALGMGAMKSDMGGAASVIGAMSAIAGENLRLNVVAVVAACENLISGNGYRPGDIIGSMSGKTIQVNSTDAEGRLTLADAVYYMVTKEKAKAVVDVATLTGAALVALGNTTTAVIANDQELYQKLQDASGQSGERVWQLPSFPEYREQNKTPHADLKNTGGREAGTITGGLFIEAFVEERPWLHLDIAGTAYTSKDQDYLAEGGTGVGVRLLYHFAESLIKMDALSRLGKPEEN